MKSCPQCLKLTKRFIKEICGHSKCRDCFIKEESGCNECINENGLVQNEGRYRCEGLQNLPTVSEQNLNKTESVSANHCEEVNVASTVVSLQPSELLPGKPLRQKSKRKLPEHIINLKVGNAMSYKCTICNKIFCSKSQRYYHLYCNETYKKPYVCNICLKRFSSSSHLKYHEEGHKDSQDHVCPKCSKTFSRSVTLEKHMRSHEKTINFHCSICNVVFRDKYAFKSHSNKHKNIFPFSCEHCEKKFSLKSSFMQHLLVHSNETSYECAHCKKRFKRNGSYKVHLLRHSKTRQYSCEVCKRVYSDNKSLLRHKRNHDESKFYKCVFCDVTTKRRDNLSRHVRNMHPEESTGDSNENPDFFVIEQSSSKQIIDINAGDLRETNYSIDVDRSQKHDQTNEVNDEKEKLHKCSVIKSVGNVKSVIISRDEYSDNINSSMNTQTDEAVTYCNQESSIKKRKRKYDPLEIYRKILFASNDEDSILEDTDKIVDTQDQALEQHQEKAETNLQQNFAEIHWRKRTSQYYSSINT